MDNNLLVSIFVILFVLVMVFFGGSNKQKEKFETDSHDFHQDVILDGIHYEVYKEDQLVDFSKFAHRKNILFAVYGSKENASTKVNHVTNVLRNAFEDWKYKGKRFVVKDSNLHGDPNKDKRKYLRIWYLPPHHSPSPTYPHLSTPYYLQTPAPAPAVYKK